LFVSFLISLDELLVYCAVIIISVTCIANMVFSPHGTVVV